MSIGILGHPRREEKNTEKKGLRREENAICKDSGVVQFASEIVVLER